MGEQMIIWPPGCGNFTDGDACSQFDDLGARYAPCPDMWDVVDGFWCCPS
jgi:hypothetical protein